MTLTAAPLTMRRQKLDKLCRGDIRYFVPSWPNIAGDVSPASPVVLTPMYAVSLINYSSASVLVKSHRWCDAACDVSKQGIFGRSQKTPHRLVHIIVSWIHTHTHLMALCPGLPGWAGTRKAKPVWILLKQETVSGSGISWAICKSAPRSRQITTPAPHRSVFYRPNALPAAQPTASKHWSIQVKIRCLNIIRYCLFCSGQTPAEAEANFLVRACQLDTYGVDPHPVKVAVFSQAVLNWMCKATVCPSIFC